MAGAFKLLGALGLIIMAAVGSVRCTVIVHQAGINKSKREDKRAGSVRHPSCIAFVAIGSRMEKRERKK